LIAWAAAAWMGMGMALATEPTAVDRDAIYMVLVDRFANGDPSNDGDANPGNATAFHGGDLAGIRQHLDAIAGLGFGTLWLSPITRMRSEPIGKHGAFHGYWVTDGSALEPRLGTLADLAGLKADLDARGMGLVLDIVTNHVAPGAPLTTKHPDWFHENGDITDWADPAQRVTHDVHGLPDLAQEQPAVQDHLIAQGQWWIDLVHPAGFRLDAVAHVPAPFIRDYRSAMTTAAGPGFALMGEIFDGNPIRVADMAAATDLTHTFDFPLHYALVDAICSGGDLRKLATVLSADADYPPGHTHLTFVDNHDTARIATACGGDKDKLVDILRLLLALRGTPVITYGTEAGLTGSTETEVRSDMVFGSDTAAGRTIQEGLSMRRQHPALRTGQTRILSATAQHLSLLRSATNGSTVLIEVGDPPSALRDTAVSLLKDPGRVWIGTIAHAPEPPPGTPTQVSFTTDGSYGDSPFFLLGSRHALGGWDPAQAVGPITAGQTLKIAMDAPSMTAFKPIRRHQDGTVEWLSEADRYLWIGPYSIEQIVVPVRR
jgi:glycosidase